MIGFKKIAALIVGASLSVGVGVGISSIDATSEVRADVVTDTIDNDATSSYLSNVAPSAWKNFTLEMDSGASYYFRSMGTKGGSQALTFNSNAYGYTVVSGGTITSIEATTNNKSVSFYGATQQITSASDGTLIGTINGNDTLVPDEEYTHLYIKGTTSSTQITSIIITYGSDESSTSILLKTPTVSTTTNMDGTNQATTYNLTASRSVVGAKGGSNYFPGINKNGYTALYYNASGSNTFTVTAPEGTTIDYITISYVSGYDNGKVLVGGEQVALTNSQYAIGAREFVLTNGNTSNVQVQFKTIRIVLVSDTTPAITLDKTSISGFVGDEGTITATASNFTPSGDRTWESGDDSVFEVSGTTNQASYTLVGEGTTTLIVSNSNISSDQIGISVSVVKPSSISTKGSSFNKYVVEGVDSFSSLVENNKVFLTVKYNNDSSAEVVDYSTITLTLGGEPIEKNHVFTNEDNGKQFVIIYTAAGFEPVRSSGVKLNVVLPVDITSLQANFTDGKSYILVDDDKSTIEFEYFSVFGTPTATVISSNSDIADVSLNTISEPDSETNYGSGTIDVLAYDLGSFYVTLTLNANGHEISINSDLYYVRSSDPASGSDKYVKITSASDLEDGQYLIVCESKSVAFDGGLSTLDAVGNTISVTPVNGEISASATTKGAEFTYNSTEKSLKSASGKYIGKSSNNNGLDSSATFGDNFVNTITFSNGNATITAKGNVILKYNSASDQTRFRYYKTGQTSIQLYKFEEGSSTDDETMVIRFIDNYMKFDVVSDTTNKGTGLCETEGWYAKAKDAFFDATATSTEDFHLNATQRALLVGHYSEAWTRLQAWATANHEVISVDGVTTLGNQGFNLIKDTNTTVVIAIVVSVTMFAVFAVATIRKRKEI